MLFFCKSAGVFHDIYFAKILKKSTFYRCNEATCTLQLIQVNCPFLADDVLRGVLLGRCYLETSKRGSTGGRRGRGRRRRNGGGRTGGGGRGEGRRRRMRSAGVWLTLQRSQHSDSCGYKSYNNSDSGYTVKHSPLCELHLTQRMPQ